MTDHPCRRYSIDPDGRGGTVAVCTCGWRSPAARAAGVAGGHWDAHVRETSVGERLGLMD